MTKETKKVHAFDFDTYTHHVGLTDNQLYNLYMRLQDIMGAYIPDSCNIIHHNTYLTLQIISCACIWQKTTWPVHITVKLLNICSRSVLLAIHHVIIGEYHRQSSHAESYVS